MLRLVHRIFVLFLFTRSRHPEFTPTLAAPVIHKWSGSFLTEGFESHRNTFVLMGSKAATIIGPLILLALLLAFLSVPISSGLGNLSSAFFICAQSATARLSSFIHAGCCAKVHPVQNSPLLPPADEGMQISRKNTELAEKCSALHIALQQIEHESAWSRFLSAENCVISNLAVGQGTNIRTQSALITQLEGQLYDRERALWHAVSYGEQHERDARAYRQEVARLEERIEILVTESNVAQSMLLLNLHSAHIRERQLCDTLHVNETLLSEAQASLRIAEETSRAQQQSLSLELGTCTRQWENWKVVAEQAETRVLDADRTMLNLRKELAVAFKIAREAKERFESQTVALCERDATIRSLASELVDVWDQLRNAKDEIDRLRSDLERTDVWRPLDSVDELQLVDESPPVLEWHGWLREAASKMSVPATRRRARSPDMSLMELESVSCRASIQAYPTPPNEILSPSTTPAIRFANLDDPFLVDTRTQPTFQLRSPTVAARGATRHFATSGLPSPLCSTQIIDELREQVSHKQLARAHAENELTLQQMKVLATEAVVVVQRRQLSNQECQLSAETAKCISLGEELRSLKVEYSTMAARVAQYEGSLAECRTTRMAAETVANDTRSELVQAKEVLLRRTKEADVMKAERDAIDMRLAQAMLLSSATNVVSTPSDGSSSSSYFAPWCLIVTHKQAQKATTA
jgi:hypothetical protein